MVVSSAWSVRLSADHRRTSWDGCALAILASVDWSVIRTTIAFMNAFDSLCWVSCRRNSWLSICSMNNLSLFSSLRRDRITRSISSGSRKFLSAASAGPSRPWMTWLARNRWLSSNLCIFSQILGSSSLASRRRKGSSAASPSVAASSKSSLATQYHARSLSFFGFHCLAFNPLTAVLLTPAFLSRKAHLRK